MPFVELSAIESWNCVHFSPEYVKGMTLLDSLKSSKSPQDALLRRLRELRKYEGLDGWYTTPATTASNQVKVKMAAATSGLVPDAVVTVT
jgi:hypothetical protein